jgi:hypothetical protein
MTTQQQVSTCLDITDPIIVDESIESYQFQDYTPQKHNLDDRSEIVIEINANDTYIIPSESRLIVEGQLRKNNQNHDAYNAADEVSLVNNGIMFLFSNIIYSINEKEMERINNPGQTSSIMGYLSYADDYSKNEGLSTCWYKDTTDNANSSKYQPSPAVPDAGIAVGGLTPRENPNYNEGFAARKRLLMSADPRGSFQFSIPFKDIFGFGEYDKVIWGVKHTLRLIRGATDNLAIHKVAGVDNGEVTISKLIWSVPHLKMETVKLNELRSILENKETIPVAFSARTTQSTSVPLNSTQFDWRLSVPGGVEKPRWIIVAFQTDRNDNQQQNPSIFDNVSLSNAYIELNNQRYPSSEIITNFTRNSYSKLYNMFCDFRKEYYGFTSLIGGTEVDFITYKSLFPIIVFDVRKQNERLKSGIVDMQLKFFFNVGVPVNTMVYSITISDRMFKFTPDGKNISIVSY